MMTSKTIQDIIDSLVSCVTFDYNGLPCGVDPLSHTHYEMWYGETAMTASSIGEVMNTNFFDGKTLKDIASDIVNVEH